MAERQTCSANVTALTLSHSILCGNLWQVSSLIKSILRYENGTGTRTMENNGVAEPSHKSSTFSNEDDLVQSSPVSRY